MRTTWRKRFFLSRNRSFLLWAIGAGAAFCLFCIAGERAGHAAAQFVPPNQEQTIENFAELSEFERLERRGDIYMARKYYPEAVEAYREMTELQPANAQFYNKLGIAYHQLMDFGAARKAYQKAVQLDPQYAQAVNNLAAIEYARKKYRSAILIYLEALELSPGDAVIYSNLGTAYFSYKRYEYAVNCYRYALILDPKIFDRGGRSGSIVHQRESKNTGAFNFYLGKTHASLGHVEETLQYLVKAWEEGFADLREALEDDVFLFLAEDPRFVELLALVDPDNAAAS